MIKNTNITQKRVWEIVKVFSERNNFIINMDDDIKSIEFYHQFHKNSKNVWVVQIKIDLMGFEGSDIINLVVSDKNETVEYWLDQNGIPQTIK
ncbi:MAG: hypothetical protein E6929_16745 [Clostridium sp.]|nr:hypothetical protein [Clostridium sp.]